MISIQSIFSFLKTDANTKLPALLLAQTLTLATIEDKINRDFDISGLYIYLDNLQIQNERDSISIIYHLHLPDYNYYANINKYIDVIKDYIYSIKPQGFGFDFLESLNIDAWPINDNGISVVYFTVNWIKEKDSCD